MNAAKVFERMCAAAEEFAPGSPEGQINFMGSCAVTCSAVAFRRGVVDETIELIALVDARIRSLVDSVLAEHPELRIVGEAAVARYFPEGVSS